jgi:type IV pilus assembly protein PilB
MAEPQKNNVRIGDLLVEAGFITTKQLDIALQKQRDRSENPEGLKIGDMLLKLGYVSETQLVHALSTRLKVSFVDLTTTKIDLNAVKKIPEPIARKHISIAYRMQQNRLYVATNDPINFFIFEELRVSTGMEIFPMLATKSSIIDAISKAYSVSSVTNVVEDINKEVEAARKRVGDQEKAEVESVERIENAPVVKLVNTLVENAFRVGASDIHFEPFADRTRIRFRIDGELQEQMRIKPEIHSALTTRLKILGGMNIAEKRVPQDGRFGAKIDNRTVDIRVSSIPTVYGEKIVIRLLTTASENEQRKLIDIGMADYNYRMYREIIRSSHGVLLVTGPTGSGKSTTLYATLRELSRPNVNIITVEDPVEKKIDGINQVQVNEKAGMTFASALRSILRQDPDIIMLGEIRDGETAEIAIRAAITGHLVLSTIHTNDAASTIARLVDMGIAPYMVASSLIGIMAQRLVRLLCPACRERATVMDKADMKLLGVENPVIIHRAHPGGCRDCNFTGYKGRTAIHEIIQVNNEIRDIVARDGTSSDIEKSSFEHGTKLLRHNVAQMVLEGKTSMDELVKATFTI